MFSLIDVVIKKNEKESAEGRNKSLYTNLCCPFFILWYRQENIIKL